MDAARPKDFELVGSVRNGLSGRAAFAPATAPAIPGSSGPDAAKAFYKWARRFSSTLITQRGRFGGDCDQYLIYLVFLLTELSWSLAEADAADRGRQLWNAGARGLNALSVSEITGIPRETTRRKLQALAAAGRLRRGMDSLHYLSGHYSRDELFIDLGPLFSEAVRLEPTSGRSI